MSLQLVKNSDNIEPFFYTGVPDEWNLWKVDTSINYGVMFDIATSPAAMAFNENIRNSEKIVADWGFKVTLKARTPLGKKLLSLRAKIIASGEPLLSCEEIDIEVRKRRGEMD